MLSRKLRALATALVLGTATVASVGVMTTTHAEAALRKQVGTPLTEALAAANAGNYSTANAKIREAESQSGRTAEENKAIADMKRFIASKSGDYASLGGAEGAQAKFAADYNARRYAEVIAAEDNLRKYNVLNATNQLVIAQAYYNMRNYAGCTRYLRSAFGNSASENVLKLQRSCAHDAGDARAATAALEQLVARTGSKEYWNILLQQTLRLRGMKETQTLDIYRLKNLTGSVTKADDYTTLAQLAIAVGAPKEGLTMVQKGIDAKMLTGERTNRLVKFASERSAAADAAAAATAAAANAAPNGDALVKLGEYQNSIGKSADAVKSIEAGIAKGVTDKNFAQVRLGQAYLGNKQKDQAARAFNAVKGDPNWEAIARLWSLYARQA